MTIFTLKNIILTTLVIALISCTDNSKNVKATVPESDTIRIMRLLLDSAFYRHNLPDISALTRNNPFGDALIFRDEIYQGDKNISRYFPNSLGDINLKFLTQQQICSLATQYQNDTSYFPNFLEIRSFKKNDTTYEVYLQNTCVIPQFDKNGNHLYRKGNLEGIDTLPCIFGIMCGGGIAVTFTKKGDTLQSKITGRWSN